uniref:Uncharacterized protein n=1 Tax=Romanomermis culicivorax TaxID=13658 RepID=A0A915K6R9_ROMCU
MDLTQAFIQLGIPLSKLSNEPLGKFLVQYTNQNIPDEKKTNNSIVMHSIIDACTTLWPGGIQYDKLLQVVSDQAGYIHGARND